VPIEIVQSAQGSYTGSSGSATLGAGTAVGNTVIIVAAAHGGGNFSTVPSGFTKDSPTTGGTQRLAVYRKPAVGAETSWTLTTTLSVPVAWVAYEFSGMDLTASPLDASSPWTTATSTTCSTGTSTVTTAYEAVALAAHVAGLTGTSPIPTLSAHTNGFTELHQQGQAGASTCVGLSVSWKPLASLTTVQSSATVSASLANGGWVVVYAAAGSKRDANIAVMAGFEWGTTAGWATGNAGNYLFGSVVGSPAIVTSTPRTGTYCLECSASAAAENVAWDTSHFGTSKTTVVVRLCVYFPGSLPGGDVELLVMTGGTGNLILRFESSSSSLAVQIGAGAEQVAATTVAADTWYGVDLRHSTVTTTYACDWQVDGVDQTQATLGGATAGAQISSVTLGWATAATATVHFDDIAVSTVAGNYPLGNLALYPLPVDVADTLTLSGTAASWKIYTANGTLATWDATLARNAVAEIPPTIGASADGLAQVTAAAAEYVQVPLVTHQAAPEEAIRSVRVYVCGWSPSVTAQSFRVDGWDGAVATTLHAVADPNFDASTTSPAWIAKMWKPSTGWTQTKLDAACVRAGFSAVAQDVGMHMTMAEVACQALADSEVMGEEGSPAATATIDPLSGAVSGIAATTPPERGTTLHWTQDGTPHDQVVAADSTHVEVTDAASIANVTDIGIESEPS
jgi:hypothetical protein